MADTLVSPQQKAHAAVARGISRIVIWPGNAVGEKWVTIARLLREKIGAQCSLLCSMPEDEAIYRRMWGDLADHIQEVTSLYRRLRDPLDSPQAIERDAVRYERRYDALMVDFLQSDRHLGLAYSTGGTSFPRSRLGLGATYHTSLRLAMQMLDFFERYLEERKPDLILMEGVGSLHTKCLAVAARARGIPLRLPAPSRYKNLVHWAGNEWFEAPWLTAQYLKTPLPTDGSPIEFDGPYLASAVERRRQRAKLSLRGMLVSGARDIARFTYQRLIGYRPYAGYQLTDTLAYRLRSYRRHRAWEQRSAVKDAGALEGLRYVFYPLNHEPEGSLTVQAPEFNNQAAVIDLLAKSLPADVRLVVKEHETTGIAARPPGFHRWLSEMPNVLLATMHMPSIPLIRSSCAVAVLTGSAGLEAAVLGIPVVTFGRYNLYNCVPHVHVVDQLSQLRPLLARLCSGDEDLEARRMRVREGRRFFDALTACSLDLGDEQLFTAGASLSERKASELVDVLLSTLEPVTT